MMMGFLLLVPSFTVQKSTPDTRRAMSQWLGSESSPGFRDPGGLLHGAKHRNNDLSLFTLVCAEGVEHGFHIAKVIIKCRRLLNLKVDD